MKTSKLDGICNQQNSPLELVLYETVQSSILFVKTPNRSIVEADFG